MPPKKAKTKAKNPEPAEENNAPVVVPRLASLPAELFDEIISYFAVLPLHYYYDTQGFGTTPDPRYRERTDVLRALSQTCRALRSVSFPRLWSRLDLCILDEEYQASWYKHAMQEIQCKAKGVISSSKELRESIRVLTFSLSKSAVKETLPHLTKLLHAVPNLHTIQIVTCKIPGDFGKAVQGVQFPSVRTVVIPTDCHAILKSCPNATHVRCTLGNGHTLIGSLKHCKCEVLDGMIDWVDPKVMDRLVKVAPNLTRIEIRRPVNWGLGILSQNKAPAEWAQVIPKLSKLSKLRVITLSFPGEEELPSDRVSINAARDVLKNSKVPEKKLIIRRVLAPHYTRGNDQKEDVVQSCVEEIFE
ncbi:hypothetical protein K474DRAFT_1686559 [Panus rudis PR-1116 ss-1]|nr:hypothetical protein K474DRAFT_1686559 [Panus rudis PR-1116 ss-1]